MRLEHVNEKDLATTYWERLWRLLWKAAIAFEEMPGPDAGQSLVCCHKPLAF